MSSPYRHSSSSFCSYYITRESSTMTFGMARVCHHLRGKANENKCVQFTFVLWGCILCHGKSSIISKRCIGESLVKFALLEAISATSFLPTATTAFAENHNVCCAWVEQARIDFWGRGISDKSRWRCMEAIHRVFKNTNLSNYGISKIWKTTNKQSINFSAWKEKKKKLLWRAMKTFLEVVSSVWHWRRPYS